MNLIDRQYYNRFLSIKSVGMVSSIGSNAFASSAAIRAGISRFEEIPFHDKNGKPIIGAPANEVTENNVGYDRMIPMICNAISECLNHYRPGKSLKNDSVFLIIVTDSSSRPDYPKNLSQMIINGLKSIRGFEYYKKTKFYAEGSIGVFRALTEVNNLFQNPDIEGCIVAGVDSMINVAALNWLEKEERLKTEENSDGVIPGEAAAAIWIDRYNPKDRSMLNIAGIGFGSEKSLLDDDKPNLAIGLSEALANALKNTDISLEVVDFQVGSMTGERSEFMEASTAFARIQRVHKDKFELIIPAESLGAVGAVLPLCMLVDTAVRIQKNYAPGRIGILYDTSHSTEKGACIVFASDTGGDNGM